MTTKARPLPVKATAATATTSVVKHHQLAPPREHLCSCGRLRDDCVRDSVRTLWTG